MISKTHISDQKPRGRQLNAEVCSSGSAIFRILLSSKVTAPQDAVSAAGLPWLEHFIEFSAIRTLVKSLLIGF